MPTHFPNLLSLKSHLQQKQKGSLLHAYRNLEDYPGVVLNINLIYDVPKNKYELDLQWIALGLDLFGEHLVEGYTYSFESLEKLLQYIKTKYNIGITDIPINSVFDENLYPNPIKDADKKAEFELAWNRFQKDFNAGKFLDQL